MLLEECEVAVAVLVTKVDACLARKALQFCNALKQLLGRPFKAASAAECKKCVANKDVPFTSSVVLDQKGDLPFGVSWNVECGDVDWLIATGEIAPRGCRTVIEYSNGATAGRWNPLGIAFGTIERSRRKFCEAPNMIVMVVSEENGRKCMCAKCFYDGASFGGVDKYARVGFSVANEITKIVGQTTNDLNDHIFSVIVSASRANSAIVQRRR